MKKSVAGPDVDPMPLNLPIRFILQSIRPRLQASATHLFLSAIVAVCVIAVVKLRWYPGPLDRASGVASILLLLLAVDVALGPLLTLVVYNRAKKNLRFDLACMVALQLAALAYGVHTVEAGRPHYLVFVKDRFEIVSRSDLDAEDLAKAATNPFARPNWFSPKTVAVEASSSFREREEAMLEAAAGGRDLQHFPANYRDLSTQLTSIVGASIDLSELRAFNPDRLPELDAILARYSQPGKMLRFVPLKGLTADLTVLVDGDSGVPVATVDMNPWK